MKTIIYVLIALLACSGLLVSVKSAYLTESSVTLLASGTIQQSQTTYSHIIRISGSNYTVENGATGQTEFQSTNAAQSINNALSRGGSILVKTGSYPISSRITGQGVNNVTLVFEAGAKFVLANNVNSPVLFLNGVDGWLIQNPTIDGNMANNQLLTDTNGIYILNSSNCRVDGANIYNCRIFGFYVLYNCVNCGITNSTVTNCGWNCITLSDEGCTGSYAINNEVSHCGDVGITTYADSAVVKDNNIHDIDGTSGSINTHWGLGVEGGTNSTLTGNTVTNADYGIVVHNSGNTAGGTCNANMISSNKFQNILICGIEIHSSDNVISGNQIIDWSASKNAITIELGASGPNTANNNQIIGNTLNSRYANANGIDVRTGVTNTLIQNNDLRGILGTKIINSGTGTQIIGNLGYP